MQQGHNFIFLKIYIHGDFTYDNHVMKDMLINNIINKKYMNVCFNI